MERKIISTKNAPGAIGPYSQAIDTGSFVYTSGQIPVNPANGELVNDDIKSATHQVLKNLSAILTEAGLSLADVVKTTVFMKNMDDFKEMNAVYGEYFNENPPARSAVQVAKLPMDVCVEIEAVAVRKN